MQADSIPAAQNGLVAELDSMAQRDDVTPAEQEEDVYKRQIRMCRLRKAVPAS